VRDVPFCDFGGDRTRRSADVTAHVVEMLGVLGRATTKLTWGASAGCSTTRSRTALVRRWGVNHVYGTGAVLPALVAAGVPVADPAIRRAVQVAGASTQTQTAVGVRLPLLRRSGLDRSRREHPSQTAWALLALEPAR